MSGLTREFLISGVVFASGVALVETFGPGVLALAVIALLVVLFVRVTVIIGPP